MINLLKGTILISTVLFIGACSGNPQRPLPTVEHVDLQRFMGDWYVIANIPTFIERDAYNAIESYRLAEDGTIDTTFSFNKGGFNGEPKRYHPTGYVRDDASNAIWGMQFIWPIKADYRIVYLDEDYTMTVIGRNRRDYVWIMARTPEITVEDYQRLLELLAQQGYDTDKIRQVPQYWPTE